MVTRLVCQLSLSCLFWRVLLVIRFLSFFLCILLFIVRKSEDLVIRLLVHYTAVDALDVEARIDNQRQRAEQEEHLEGWEVGHLHTPEVVAYHVAWAQYEVANAAEHAPVAQPPDVEVEQEGVLKRVADYLALLSATGTVVALVMGAARGAHMLFLGERGYLVRLLFPLAEPSVFVL